MVLMPFFSFFFILSFEKSQKDRYLVLKYTTDGEPFNREPLIEHILKNEPCIHNSWKQTNHRGENTQTVTFN